MYVASKQSKLIVFVHCGILIGQIVHVEESRLLSAPFVKFSLCCVKLA